MKKEFVPMPSRDTRADRAVIQVAKALMMNKHNMSEREAYDFIRISAMKARVKKSLIAQEIINNND